MAKAKFLNGLFAAHKPAGVSSASITNHIKEVIIQGLKQQGEVKVSGGNNPTTTIKVGHGGTLDLNASGVLVLGIGRGTKALGPYLKGQKVSQRTNWSLCDIFSRLDLDNVFILLSVELVLRMCTVFAVEYS